MARTLRELAKRLAGDLLATAGGSRYRYDRCIFIIAHMRCGSTALSNIICSRPDVSGYGEAHVRYDGRGALGRLAINQRRRGGWNGKAGFLFDKILHSRHDSAAPEEFRLARAIFVVREPEPAIRSICQLYADLGRDEYASPAEAAAYYAERVGAMAELWDSFPRGRRIGLTHRGLLQDPDAALQAISQHLRFDPPLENRYRSPAASRLGGGGDPIESGKHSRIEPALLRPTGDLGALDLPPALITACEDRFAAMQARIAADWPHLVA